MLVGAPKGAFTTAHTDILRSSLVANFAAVLPVSPKLLLLLLDQWTSFVLSYDALQLSIIAAFVRAVVSLLRS